MPDILSAETFWTLTHEKQTQSTMVSLSWEKKKKSEFRNAVTAGIRKPVSQ